MNKFLKGLGIFFLVLVGLAVVAAIFLFGGIGRGMPMMYMGLRGTRMMGGFGVWSGVMMIARILLPILFITLMVLIGVAIGRSGRKEQQAVQPAAQSAASPAAASVVTGAPVESNPVVAETAPARKCAHCGAELQDGWVNCPYCGLKI
jgi:uncharacterized membrane protein